MYLYVFTMTTLRALGHSANRGKVYYLHPKLFKVVTHTTHYTHYTLTLYSMSVTVMTRHGCMRISSCLYTEARRS